MDIRVPGTKQRIRVDFARHEVYVDNRRVDLSASQLDIIKLLVEADGKVVTRQQIAKAIFNIPSVVHKRLNSRSVDQHISRLRRALGTKRRLIRTVVKRGYSIARS